MVIYKSFLINSFKMIFLRLGCALLALGVLPVQAEITFPAAQADFAAYQREVKDHLDANSLAHRGQAAIALNAPFSIAANKAVPYRGKFLLFHGLNDSPFVWHDLAEDIADRGFDVRAILFPAHGSHPQETIDVSYKQWINAARAHLKFWNTDDTPMHLGGFSLGGVIATILALENEDLDGLLLFSPAYHSSLNNYLRWSGLYSYFRDWLFNTMLIEDNPVKYNSISINSGSQYFKTTRVLKRKWGDKTISIPTLVVVTADDSVVDVNYTRKVFQTRFKSTKKTLLIYSNDETLPLKPAEILRSSAYPELRILNQSHLSVTNAPDNILYGGANGLLICNGNEYPIFMACLDAKQHWYGAQHTPSPDGVAVARTTINPDYDTVLALFDEVFSLEAQE